MINAGFVDDIVTLVGLREPGPFVVQPKQFDGARNISNTANSRTTPQPLPAARDALCAFLAGEEMLADAQRGTDIKQPVAMNVSEFPPANPKLPPAKTVGPGFDTWPTEHRRLHLFRSTRHVLIPEPSELYGSPVGASFQV